MATSKNAVEIDVEFKINKALQQIKRLTTNVSNAVTQSNKLASSTNKTSNSLGKADKNAKNLKNDLKNADLYAKSMAESATIFSKALVSVALGTQLIEAADAMGSAVNKLNYVNAQNMGATAYDTDKKGNKIGYSDAVNKVTANQMDKIFNAAQASRSNYGQFINDVGKQAILAGDAFNHNIDAVIKFNELMGKAYTISGASSEEKLSSMMQLTQALGAGVMQGDELKSVREGATLAYQMIEKYAQELYDTDESLKDLGSQGKITSDIVVAGILENAKALDDAMKLTSLTVGQFWTLFKNDVTKAFEPAIKEFNKFLAVFKDSALYDVLLEVIRGIAGGLSVIFKIATAITQIIDKNKKVLLPFLYAIATVLTLAVVKALVLVQVELLKTIFKFMRLPAPILAVIGMVTALYFAFDKMSKGVLSGTTLIGTSLFTILSIISLIVGTVLMFVNPILGVIVLIIGYLAGVAAQATYTSNSILVGVATVVGSVAQAGEVIVATSNWVWEECGRHLGAFKEACITAWENVQTVFKNFCDNIVSYWDSMIGKLANTKLGKALGLEAIHRHAVVDLRAGTESVTGAYNDYLANHPNSVNIEERGDAAYSKWYSKTLTWGHKVQSNMKDMIGGLNVGNAGNLDYGLPPVNPGVNDALGDIGKTADNTDKISDNMHLVTDDLKYLRDLAELEWKKEFTTANINVSMTNNNKIDNKNDIGDIAVALRDEIMTNMKTVAAGSYS